MDLTSTDRVEDLKAIAVLKALPRVRGARDDALVSGDGDAAPLEAQEVEKSGDARSARDAARFAVYLDPQSMGVGR
jgi:hypothetical protein